jgi:hypothetical protein
VLHLLDAPLAVVRLLCERLPPGSQLVVSHLTPDRHLHDLAALTRLAAATGIRWTVRTRAEVQQLVTGLGLVSPGLSDAVDWRPGHLHANPPTTGVLTAVAYTRSRVTRRTEWQ